MFGEIIVWCDWSDCSDWRRPTHPRKRPTNNYCKRVFHNKNDTSLQRHQTPSTSVVHNGVGTPSHLMALAPPSERLHTTRTPRREHEAWGAKSSSHCTRHAHSMFESYAPIHTEKKHERCVSMSQQCHNTVKGHSLHLIPTHGTHVQGGVESLDALSSWVIFCKRAL